MIVRPGYGGRLYRLVRKGTRQSVWAGTRVVDRDGEEYAVVGGIPPRKQSSTGYVHLSRPGTSTVHEVYVGVYGFEWVDYGVDRRGD